MKKKKNREAHFLTSFLLVWKNEGDEREECKEITSSLKREPSVMGKGHSWYTLERLQVVMSSCGCER